MDETSFPILSLLLWLPLLGALLVILIPGANKVLIRGFTMVFALVGLAVSAVVWADFDGTQAGLQMVEKVENGQRSPFPHAGSSMDSGFIIMDMIRTKKEARKKVSTG